MPRPVRTCFASLCACIIAVTAIITSTPLIRADPSYTAIDLGTLNNGDLSSWAWSVNEIGQVVGYSDAPNQMSIHAFLWEDGEMTDIHTLGGTYSWAYGINNSSQITGYSSVNGITIHGFLWEDGTMNDIGAMPGARGTFSRGNAINEFGVIAGISHSTRPGWIVPYTGFTCDLGNDFHTSPGSWTEIPTFGGSESMAYGINDFGEAVGYSRFEPPEPTTPRAFLFSDGELVDLGTLGGNYSWADNVNDLGQVVGTSTNEDEFYRAFIWINGLMTDLGDFGGDESWAHGINDLGQVVGKADTEDGSSHGFLLDDGIMWDLNEIVQPGLDVVFRSARGINNVGQIVTSAVLPDDSRHAYLLTPGLLHLDAPDPGIAGMVNTYTAGDAVPGEMVDFYEGSVPLPTAIDECSAIVQIKDPTTLGSAVAGPDGTASIEIFVSGKESGEMVFIQAGEWTDCVPSNLVRHTFQ